MCAARTVKESAVNLCILSGKGGTGKSTLSVSLAAWLAENLTDKRVTLLDCDVEEPNAHLYLTPPQVTQDPVSVLVPRWQKELCTQCGRCSNVCQFGAFAVLGDRIEIFSDHCHNCGACSYICPYQALPEHPHVVGRTLRGEVDGLELIWGELKVGEPRSTPVIEAVRRQAGEGIVVIDGPPGTSCGMVAAASGVDLALVVTEPTLFGRHDLELALDALRALEVPCAVVINKSLFGDAGVRSCCERHKVPVLLEIPFRRDLAGSSAQQRILHRFAPEFNALLALLWGGLQHTARQGKVTA